jgi:signal transduction histidine kinase/DNA-binding response OmpR family regulator/purine-cytosine permease-like protein
MKVGTGVEARMVNPTSPPISSGGCGEPLATEHVRHLHTRHPIARVRRQYNQWVADQTLEDYALRFTADSARRWSSFRVGNTALGAISFLACEAIGGTLTLTYGFTNSMLAILAGGILIFATSFPIAYYAAKSGVDMDLLTRGAGFGYIGSTITSLVYACFTFVLFALEATIMSQALELVLGIPLPIAHLISALLVIPIALLGIRMISGMQMWTQPIWLLLQLAPLAYLLTADPATITGWTEYAGAKGSADGAFQLTLFGAAVAIVLSLIPQIGEQVDYLRFLPDRRRVGKAGWWTALIAAGPGWILIGAAKLAAGSFLAYIALRHGVPVDRAAQPVELYRIAFTDLLHSPGFALAITGIFVVVCQMKINVTNAYAGSIAWSNFFARVTHSHPGRVVWLVFNVLLALLLMELGIFKVLEHILGLYSNLAVAWIGALAADLVISKPLGYSPKTIEFRRAHLYDVNPVGVGAMGLSLMLSTAAHFGAAGEVARALAPILGFVVSFMAAPAIACLTKGRYYLARAPEEMAQPPLPIRCSICEHSFEPNDMSYCPAYSGPICSLCCSLEMRCHDRCKPHSRLVDQVTAFMRVTFPPWVMEAAGTRIGRFAIVTIIMVSVTGLMVSVLGWEYATVSWIDQATLAATLKGVFTGLVIIMGLSAWALVLAHDSRRMAEEETARQTAALMEEIEAHKRTDAALQKAKEVAEAANVAKSRFIVGLSHEIRTPLNSISGYAQILERKTAARPDEAVRVIRRSAEHITSLVDGLMDISKIEAGSLRLSRDVVRIGEFLDQLTDMFSLQASAKGLAFHSTRAVHLPTYVHADQKRLRQILLNLLSNAIKYTATGAVSLDVRYDNGLAVFKIADTGMGVEKDDLERIFAPFERGKNAGKLPGTGLGLTIVKLLTQILGGDITVTSTPALGSTFTVQLLLSEAEPKNADNGDRVVTGYRGQRRTVLVVDDNTSQRTLLQDILESLGFIVFTAEDGQSCLDLAPTCNPELIMLDISMPGMRGWDVARELRERGLEDSAIIMVSADVHELMSPPSREMAHDDYIAKPFDLPQLLDRIQTQLGVEWIYATPADNAGDKPRVPRLARRHIDALQRLGEIGRVRGIEAKLQELESAYPGSRSFLAQLRRSVRNQDFDRYLAILEAVKEHAE